VGGLITAFVLGTLGYDYVTNAKRVLSTTEILWTSLTTLPNRDFQTSYGILALMITLWLAACVLFTAENRAVNRENWLSALGLTMGISGGLGLFFWFILANGLAGVVRTAIIHQQQSGGAITLEGIISQATKLEGLLTTYYFYIIGLIVLLARFVAADWSPRLTIRGAISLATVPAMILVVGSLISLTNLRIIHADIAFKLADPFARGDDPEQWQFAIELYQRANRYAPSEDFYYLFLGRAYLERARLLQGQNPIETEQLMEQAKNDLIFAQNINPLNTDHTANLARLHRFWASVTADPIQRNELAEEASDYYSRAVVLSPNNAVIWNEWAVLYISLLQNSDRALEFLLHSLDVDPDYFGTYGILAQLYAQSAQQASDDSARKAAYEQAVKYYQGGIEHIQRQRDSLAKYGYLVELAGLHTNFGAYEAAISTYHEALPLANNNQAWRVEDAMARLYLQLGERETALEFANSALLAAPENQKSGIQELIALIQQPSP
jgi:tetratricopeptide (TPR) repeat protein